MSKRIEIYISFKCNNDCVFCIEKDNRKKYQDEKLFRDKADILRKLKSLKQQGYNHINFLGGEPFMASQIYDVLKTAKQLGFLTALATNGSLLANQALAKTTLPLIDDLIISIHGHNDKIVTRLSRNKVLFENLNQALSNIRKYFKGRTLKVNCVINLVNYKNLLDILKFIHKNGIYQINFTMMDIYDYNQDYAVSFKKIKKYLDEVVAYAFEHDLIIRFSELPLCILKDNYFLSDDLYFEEREKRFPDKKDDKYFRTKIKAPQCEKCGLNGLCRGLDRGYYKIYGDKELIPV